MFNGIIKKTGKISRLYRERNNCSLYILSKLNFNKNEIGSSVSCSGACLTLEKYNKNLCKFYISKETLNRTIFKFLKKGDIVNLEKPLKYGDRVSGHLVQGHVDTTAKVKKIHLIGKSWLVSFALSDKFKKLLITKGSITINGVSLTIAKILNNSFQIAIVPQTLKFTNLIHLKEGDFVNIEFDILTKYIKKFLRK